MRGRREQKKKLLENGPLECEGRSRSALPHPELFFPFPFLPFSALAPKLSPNVNRRQKRIKLMCTTLEGRSGGEGSEGRGGRGGLLTDVDNRKRINKTEVEVKMRKEKGIAS